MSSALRITRKVDQFSTTLRPCCCLCAVSTQEKYVDLRRRTVSCSIDVFGLMHCACAAVKWNCRSQCLGCTAENLRSASVCTAAIRLQRWKHEGFYAWDFGHALRDARHK